MSIAMKIKYFLLYITLLPALCSCLITQAVLKKCEKRDNYDEAKGLFGCKYKVVVSFSADKDDTDVNYITVNEVLDERLKEKVKLFHPLGIRFQNHDLSLVYPLKFLKSVNNKAYEIFFHKDNTDNYQGCTTSTLQSLCGEYSDTDGGQQDQQYQHGFCCACNKEEYISHPYHIRSGQDCSDTSTPKGLDKTYHSSAHCLKFDPVWYRVNQLEEPYIDHQVEIDVFTLRQVSQKNQKWIPISDKSQHLVISSTKKFVLSKDKKVSARYGNLSEMTKLLIPDPLKYRQNRLLIPESSPYSDYSKYIPQQLQGNASEFLLIDERYFKLDGSQCDRIGVSYEAFYQQEDKCLKPAQSCLDNQPMQFWLKDVANQMQRKKVKFFVGGYAELSKPPLYKSDANNWKLALKYKQNLTLKFSVEISADSLIPIYKGTECDIEEVYYYTENDNETLSVYLYNPAMVTNTFGLHLDSCNVSQNSDVNRTVTVGPHQSKEVILKISTEHSNYIKHCTVSVLNHRQQKVAERQIWFKDGQRCICLLNCKCSCEADGFICAPLDGEDEVQISFPLFIILLILLLLFIIGLVKATLSVFSPIKIGQVGLGVLSKYITLKEYYEKDINKITVIYNKDGYPIHPTKNTPVQFLPTWKIILLNLCIGFCFPVILVFWIFDKFCRKLVGKAFIKQIEESAEPFLSVSSPDLRGLKNYFHTSPSKLANTDQDLSLEQFRKKKKDLSKLRKINEESKKKLSAYDITPPDSDDEHTVDEKLVSSDLISKSSINKGVEQVRSYNRKTRSSTTSAMGQEDGSSLFKRQTILNLLHKNQVYCNYDQESKNLHNSGTHYSLRGVLRKLGRKYNFELGDYVIQTYENDGGSVRPLHPYPQRIIHPMQFNLLLNASGVHIAITEEPKYPCLNASPPPKN